MPRCASCKVNLPPDNHLGCEKCKKSFHCQCTDLDDFLIKQHQKNPYMIWRCPICTEKYCISCNKTFPEECLDSIFCDRCSFWYHLRCTELSIPEFQHLSSPPSEKWKCRSCIDKFCNKCDLNTHNKPKSKCCLCKNTYHF